MKQSVDNKIDFDMIEKLKKAERNERTKEESFDQQRCESVLDPDSRPKDLTHLLNYNHQDDPLNLDGPIGPIAAS